MSIKYRIPIVLCIIGLFFLNWGGIVGLRESARVNQETMYMGTIQDVRDKETAIKNGTETEFHMVVNFDSLGIRDIRVNSVTYYTHRAGERIGFKLDRREAYGDDEKWSMLTLLSFFADVGALCYVINLINEYYAKRKRRRKWQD